MMKAALKTVIGLVFDDWWMGVGIMVSIVISYFVVSGGVDAQMSGWLLLLLMIGTLILSLTMEYRKKTRKKQ
jgi:hypothetical protein